MASSRRPPPRPRPTGPRPARPSGQPGQPRQASWITPGARPLRIKIETASRGPLLRMYGAPRWALFLAFLGLAVGAGVAPAIWGALCALVLAVFLGWLLFLAWPKLSPGARAMRLLVIAILIGAVIAKIVIG